MDPSLSPGGALVDSGPALKIMAATALASLLLPPFFFSLLPGTGVDIVDAFGGADAISPDSFKSSADVAASMQTTVAKPALPTTPLDVPAKLLMGTPRVHTKSEAQPS